MVTRKTPGQMLSAMVENGRLADIHIEDMDLQVLEREGATGARAGGAGSGGRDGAAGAAGHGRRRGW